MSLSPSRRRSATRPAIVAGATLLALAVTGATPALADQATTAHAATSRTTAAAQATPVSSVVEGLQDDATGYCLDSNAAGQLYTTNPCQPPGNAYQMWALGGSGLVYIDTATGLVLDSNFAKSAYTHSPNGGLYQDWIPVS